MIEISEIELPGIGMKYSLESTRAGDRIVLILHISGKREIYFFDKKSSNPTAVITLSDEEARKLGAILGGAYFKAIPDETLELILSELVIDWIKIKPGSSVIEKSIGGLDLRHKTGISIIAILRKPRNIPNPGHDVVLNEGDTLVVIGTREQLENFKKIVEPAVSA